MTAAAMPPVPSSLQALATLPRASWDAVLAAPPAQAAAWMLAAARLGHAQAQAVLGQWLLDGHGVARQPEDAFAWFRIAARQGHAMAMNMAGRCRENGWGTAVDMPAAVGWYRQAADKGLDAGLYNLANQLASGVAITQDHAQALALYRRAVDLGHVKSMAKVGRYLEDGLVVDKDLAEAFDCYRRGAEGGDFRAQFCYAGMLAAQGQHAQALSWLEQVVSTATPRYLSEAGRLLSASPHPGYRGIGLRMLERSAAPAR